MRCALTDAFAIDGVDQPTRSNMRYAWIGDYDEHHQWHDVNWWAHKNPAWAREHHRDWNPALLEAADRTHIHQQNELEEQHAQRIDEFERVNTEREQQAAREHQQQLQQLHRKNAEQLQELERQHVLEAR